MKRFLTLSLLALSFLCPCINAQSSMPSPIEVLDLNSAVALCKQGDSADPDAMAALKSKTYTVAGTFDAKYNAAKGTFSIRLPQRIGTMVFLETDDPHFDMKTTRGMFTSSPVDAAQGKEIENTPCTLILEMRPTGRIRNGKLVMEPVSVCFRGMTTGEDVYVYNVEEQ